MIDKNAAQDVRKAASDRLRGCRFQHYKGGTYIVEDVAVVEATGQVVVVYRSDARGYLWTRPIDEFEDFVRPGERRFSPVFREDGP